MTDNVFTESTDNYSNSIFSKRKYASTANEKMKRQVDEFMSQHVDTNTFYKDVLRGILSQVKLSYVDEQGSHKELSLHHGRQERAIAKKFQENNIILPYATVFQSLVEEDKNKRRYEPVLVYRSLWNAKTNKAERIVNYPDVPVSLNYTLSLWCKYVSDIDQISANIRSRFNPHLIVKMPETQVMKCFLAEETDRSVVDVNDKEDRLIRKEFTIKVECYLPSPKFLVTNTNQIRKIQNIIEIDKDQLSENETASPTGDTTYYISWE